MWPVPQARALAHDDDYWLTLNPASNAVTAPDAFGRDDAEIIPDPTFCPIRFQGQWEDAETGLYYNRFRYYEPHSTSYISRDPIGVRGDVASHRYSVAPQILVDPFGLVPCRCCGWGSFEGEIGNSLFSPDDPASLGLRTGDTIPFNDGIPDFGQYSVPVGSVPGVFDVPGLTGHPGTDRAMAVRQIASRNGWTQARAERELLRMGG